MRNGGLDMFGVYEVGGNLKGIYSEIGLIVVVGWDGVIEIVVDRVNGLMGFYVVVNVFKGDVMVSVVYFYLCLIVDV